MRRNFLLIFCFVFIGSWAQAQTIDTVRHEVLLETTMGNIRIALYNETPSHRDHFLRIIRRHKYDGVLFHRVIDGFMIQAGDPYSKKAKAGEVLGDHSIGLDTVPQEVRLPLIYHKRGALAAAREPDENNPKRLSGSQFYIVYGRTFTDGQLDAMQLRLDSASNGTVKMTPKMRETYKTLGGTPHLDGAYTVYGEVLEGMDVVDKIQKVATDANDRPLEDVRILKAREIK